MPVTLVVVTSRSATFSSTDELLLRTELSEAYGTAMERFVIVGWTAVSLRRQANTNTVCV